MRTSRVRGVAVLAATTAILLAGAWNVRADTTGTPIAVGTNPQQAQLAPDSSKLYVSNEGNTAICPISPGTESVISTATNTVIGTIPVGVDPGPIRFSPDGSTAYVVNQSPCDPSGSVSVINVPTGTVTSTVAVGKLPVTLSVSEDGAKVYVANKGATSNSVSVICTGLVPAVCSATNTVVKTIVLDKTIGIQPHVMAKSRNGAELWVAEQDCPAVLGCTTGNVAVICTGYLVTSTCNAGNADTVVANISVGPTPGSIHFTHEGSRAYIATRGNGAAPAVPAAVADVNAISHSVSSTIQIHPADVTLPAPHALRVALDDSRVYVLNRHANDVDVICTGIVPTACAGADVVVKHIAVGTSPARAELTPNGGRLYVTNEGSNTVTVISTNLDLAMETLSMGARPVDLEINDAGTQAYVTDSLSNDVSRIIITGDTDYDGYSDSAESGQPLCGNGKNDDGNDDSVVDDGCPDGPPKAGTFSEAQFNIGTSAIDPCGLGSWPSDFVSGGIPNSTDKITVTDLTSFLAPMRRLDTSPGNPNFNSRWDLTPGRGLFANMISVNDLTALIAGSSGFPPMLGGTKAFNGPTCPG